MNRELAQILFSYSSQSLVIISIFLGARSESNERTFKQEFFQDICTEEEGTFEWNGTSIKFILVGYNSSESRTFELVGLVVKKDLIEWFNQNNFKSKKQDYFIYQKTKGKNSWPFFNKVLGDKFQQPNQDFLEKIDLLFPDDGCIWRYKDSNNFHFLNRAIAFASRHLPEVQGWYAVDADKPLRLVLFEEQKQDQTIPQLDETWTPSYPFLPNRYSWNRWLDRSCTLSRDVSVKTGQEMVLIKQLLTDGSNGEDQQKGHNFQEQNLIRLLFAPGTLTIGDRNIFCKRVTYEFTLIANEQELPSPTMKIELDYPERQIGDNEKISLRLSGKFQAWEQEKEEETRVKIVPSDAENWGIIDEKSQSIKSGNDGVLYTQILSPTYSDKEYSGIYIKHEQDDEMILDIHPCRIPLVLGSVQKYRKELERADITISGEKLAISISSHSQKLDDSEAIILDKSEIKLNHGEKIVGQSQQKVDFLSQNIEIGGSQVNVNSAQMEVNSMVNVSNPSPKMPKPITPAQPPTTNKPTSKKKPESKSSNINNTEQIDLNYTPGEDVNMTHPDGYYTYVPPSGNIKNEKNENKLENKLNNLPQTPNQEYGPKFRSNRPPGLPNNARTTSSKKAALPYVEQIAKNQNLDDNFVKTVRHLALTESGGQLARPANSFDVRPLSERPKDKSYISAWGVFQFNRDAWRSLPGVSNEDFPWDATPSEEISKPIEKYAKLYSEVKNNGGSSLDAARGVRLWHMSPNEYKNYVKNGKNEGFSEAWQKVEEYKESSIPNIVHPHSLARPHRANKGLVTIRVDNMDEIDDIPDSLTYLFSKHLQYISYLSDNLTEDNRTTINLYNNLYNFFVELFQSPLLKKSLNKFPYEYFCRKSNKNIQLVEFDELDFWNYFSQYNVIPESRLLIAIPNQDNRYLSPTKSVNFGAYHFLWGLFNCFEGKRKRKIINFYNTEDNWWNDWHNTIFNERWDVYLNFITRRGFIINKSKVGGKDTLGGKNGQVDWNNPNMSFSKIGVRKND